MYSNVAEFLTVTQFKLQRDFKRHNLSTNGRQDVLEACFVESFIKIKVYMWRFAIYFDSLGPIGLLEVVK